MPIEARTLYEWGQKVNRFVRNIIKCGSVRGRMCSGKPVGCYKLLSVGVGIVLDLPRKLREGRNSGD